MKESDPARLIRITLNGVSGPIRVNGALFNGAMPAHRDLLDDRRLAAVLTYIRQAWGNGAPPVDAGTVGRIRAETASRSAPWSEAGLGRPR